MSKRLRNLLLVFILSPAFALTLKLDAYETRKFEEFGGIGTNLVNARAQLKTALHGWANQLSGCPCTCRSHHPWEMAVLHGINPNQSWEPLGLSISALGQMAAPVQSCWIASCYMEDVAFHILHPPLKKIFGPFFLIFTRGWRRPILPVFVISLFGNIL